MPTNTNLKEKVSINVEIPSLYKVVFINDDKTPMQFVIEVLSTIFHKDLDDAKDITLEIHNTGSGIAGVYPFEIAEQKVIETTTLARAHSFPLQVSLEKE
jgi:ATP-dependent Clp protease adaptor protein ClpS